MRKGAIYIFKEQGGYIALISVVIISVLLMTVAFTLSFSGFFNRFTVLDSEFKEVSNGLAEACADMAILKIAENSFYTGNEWVNVGSSQCHIRYINTQNVIEVQATSTVSANNYSYTNLVIKISTTTSDVTVDSWEEMTNF